MEDMIGVITDRYYCYGKNDFQWYCQVNVNHDLYEAKYPTPQRAINDLEPPACFYYALNSVNLTVPIKQMRRSLAALLWQVATLRK